MKHKFLWLLTVCLFVCSYRSFSQTAKFSADVNAGCSSLFVTFTNQSSGFSAAAVYSLNFGEGGDIPFVSTATHTYVAEKTYTATLTITDNGNTYKATQPIIVYKKPTVDFASNVPKACVNTAINFTSSSTQGDGDISSYLWDFGDGDLLDTTSGIVQHTYTSARNPNISVTLKVTDKNGCYDTKTKNVLTLLAAPKASFTVNQTSICNVNDPVVFTNTTTGGTLPTTYLWSFNDGNTSTEVNPVYVYSRKGIFNVKLIATSADGCQDVPKVTVITVASSKSGITLPTLLCLNANLTFLDSSLPQTNTPVWKLDGAQVATNVHQYQTTFTDTKPHTLQLINNYGACSDTATKTVQAVAAPVPSPFLVNIAGSCSVPVTASFTDAGAGSTKWEWDFNNTNAASFHPSKFTKTADTTYSTENTYYVKLRVTDASGCTGEIRQPVIIKKNATTITSSEGANGCQTLTTIFKATSTSPVAEYNWMFADDKSSSVLPSPTHIFIKLGTYQVKLKIKTTGGCNDSAIFAIHIGNAPVFDFQLSNPADTLVCGNKIVNFKVTGDTDNLVGQYFWNFGDLKNYTLLTGTSYSHQYTLDSLYDVSLIINNKGCDPDTLTKKAFLRVTPPFPKISAAINSCDDRLKVVFKETTKKAQTYSWNFGDNTPVYTYDSLHIQSEITHTYSKTAAYKVVLTTINGTCVAKDSLYARVLRNQQPVLTSKQTVFCGSDSLSTVVSNMDLSPYGSFFQYSIKDIQYESGIPFTGNYTSTNGTYAVPFYPTINGLNPGDQKIRIITNSYGFNCPDTTNYISLQINGPTAGFQLADSAFCLAGKVFFDDTSKQAGATPITSWHWFFGDSTEQTLTSGGDIFHKYTDPGSFKAKLVVTDAQNCRDTALFAGSAITVKGPKARFSIETNPILPNTPEVFTNLTDSGYGSRANNTYQWDFGDGASSTSNADKVSHIYKLYSDDTVKLVATSSTTGCTDSATDVVHVKNTNLKFTYTFPDPNKLCPPVQVNFLNQSLNFEVVSWDFGDGQKADNKNNPQHIYNAPGIYKVTIFGYYDDNTYDSTWDYITIIGPTAVLHADVVPGCGTKQVILTAETKNTTSLSWDFQDGTSSPDSVVSHYYKTPNVYTPVLTVKNGPSCVFSYPFATPIAIDSIHVDINFDSIKQCHQLLANFKPYIYSVAKKNNQKVDYSWDFGDGVSASQDDTTAFTFTKPGTYKVTFTATSPYGCTDKDSIEIAYTDPPHATIQAAATEFCENTPQTFSAVKLNGSDALTYEWTFENGTSDLQNPPPQTFTAAWSKGVRLISKYNNCSDTVYQPLIIHSQPQVSYSMSDSVVCSGTAITFTAKPLTNNPQDHFTYQWNFGNGANSTDSATTYTYPKAGVYTPVLHVDNAGQCSGDFKPVIKLLIDSLVVGIGKDSVIGCHQLLVNFKPSIYGVARNNGGEMTYNWQFGDGVSTSTKDTTAFAYTKPGLYAVTFMASTKNGCSATATGQVDYSDPFPVSIQASQSEFCEKTSQTFTAVKNNNSDVLTYDWTFENGTSTLQTPPAQTFTAAWKDSIRLVVDKNGCKDTLYFKPKVHGIPNIAIGLSDSVSCLGKTVMFTAKNITTLPEPVDYVWNFGGGNTDNQPTTSYLFTATAKYTVSLTATSQFGCSNMVYDTVLINPTPVAMVQALQDVCVGNTVTFTGSSNIASSQYEWHFSSDNSQSALQNPVKTYGNGGFTENFYLVVKAGNCSDTTDIKTLTVHNLPRAVFAAPAPRACRGDSAQITVTGGQSYQWLNASSITNPSVADPLVFPLTDTRYTVQITDQYGCKNLDSILVTITQPQTVSVVSPLNVCIGSKATLTASGTDTYKWSDSAELDKDNIASPMTKDSASTKTYTVTGSDAYGCFASNGTVNVIVRPKPLVDAGAPNQTVPAGTDVQLSATADDNNVTWKWNPPTYLSCANCISPVSKVKGSLTYIASATNSFGCVGYDTTRINVICKESLVDVPQIFSPNGDGRNDRFHVLAQGIKTITHFVIYGRNGNKVFERNNVSPFSNDASWDGMSDHQYMPSGTYVYMIQAVCDVDNVVFNLQGTITLVR